MINWKAVTATRLRTGMLVGMRDARTTARSKDTPTAWLRIERVDRGMFTRVTFTNRAVVRLMPNNVVLVADVHNPTPEG